MYPLHKFVEENALEEARCLAGVRELLEYSKSGVLGNTIAGATRPLQGSLFTRRLVYTPSWPSGVDYGARLISARFPRNRWNAIRAEFCLVPPFFASLIIIIILITIIVVVVGATRHDHRADPGRGRRQPRQPQLLPRPAPDVGRLRRVVYRRRGPDWRRPHRQDVGARPLVRSIALPLHCHCKAIADCHFSVIRNAPTPLPCGRQFLVSHMSWTSHVPNLGRPFWSLSRPSCFDRETVVPRPTPPTPSGLTSPCMTHHPAGLRHGRRRAGPAGLGRGVRPHRPCMTHPPAAKQPRYLTADSSQPSIPPSFASLASPLHARTHTHTRTPTPTPTPMHTHTPTTPHAPWLCFGPQGLAVHR